MWWKPINYNQPANHKYEQGGRHGDFRRSCGLIKSVHITFTKSIGVVVPSMSTKIALTPSKSESASSAVLFCCAFICVRWNKILQLQNQNTPSSHKEAGTLIWRQVRSLIPIEGVPCICTAVPLIDHVPNIKRYMHIIDLLIRRFYEMIMYENISLLFSVLKMLF